jgi:hypothetical protein
VDKLVLLMIEAELENLTTARRLSQQGSDPQRSRAIEVLIGQAELALQIAWATVAEDESSARPMPWWSEWQKQGRS